MKYTTWEEYRQTLLTPEELGEIDERVKIICDKIDKKKKNKTN